MRQAAREQLGWVLDGAGRLRSRRLSLWIVMLEEESES